MPLPKYLSWTGCGSSCGEPPGVFTGGTMHLFGIAASRVAAQALADQFLNPVAKAEFGNRLRYTSFVDAALITFLDIDKCTTSAEAIGWFPGRECALWIPLFETKLPKIGQVALPKIRVVMWSPYIFINYAIGMVTGREVWGWSKALGNIGFPAAGAATPKFTLSTVLFDTFNPLNPGRDGTLLELTGTTALSTASTWTSFNAAAKEIIGRLTGVPATSVPAPFSSSTPKFPSIALKQFRDSQAPDRACYQALVNSPVRLKTFGGGGLHGGNFSLKLTTCDSHPIVTKFLGKTATAGSTTLPLDWGAWVKFDFDALAGTEIARSV